MFRDNSEGTQRCSPVDLEERQEWQDLASVSERCLISAKPLSQLRKARSVLLYLKSQLPAATAVRAPRRAHRAEARCCERPHRSGTTLDMGG